jgi:hypothetical protein
MASKMDKDETKIGTAAYQGHAYFWAYEYRHLLRDVTPVRRRAVHSALLHNGLSVDGESPDHEAVITTALAAKAARGGKRRGAGRPQSGRAVTHQVRVSDWAAKFLRSFADGANMSLVDSVDMMFQMAYDHALVRGYNPPDAIPFDALAKYGR